MNKVAFVTGANRGLGWEVCKQLREKGYRIALGSRDEKKGTEAAKKLDPTGETVTWVGVDTMDSASIRSAMQTIEKKFGRLDVLVNNAGILPSGLEGNDTLKTPRKDLRDAMETNTFGAFELCQLAIPLMKKNKWGRIVNVSSGMGQLSEMAAGYVAYRLSKTAMNAVTKILAEENKGAGILVNSVCPGWVQTDMGGKNAHRQIPQGAASIVWAALLPDSGPTGGFFRDGEPLSW